MFGLCLFGYTLPVLHRLNTDQVPTLYLLPSDCQYAAMCMLDSYDFQ